MVKQKNINVFNLNMAKIDCILDIKRKDVINLIQVKMYYRLNAQQIYKFSAIVGTIVGSVAGSIGYKIGKWRLV